MLENLYISSVISGDSKHIAKALRGIIRCQKLLNIDSSTYQKELNALSPSKQKEPVKKKDPKKVVKKTIKKVSKKALAIKYIQEKENNIILKFDRAIREKDVFFFKIKTKEGYKNVYDIRANLNFKTPQLRINGLSSIKIAQNRKDKVRIVLQNKAKIYSKAFIRKGSLFIKINDTSKTSDKIEKPKKIIQKKPITKVAKKAPIMIEHKPHKQQSTQTIYASSKTIVIDAGHGGYDSGAVGYKKYQEKRAVLKV
ncbi:MAG TPA: hypothetical protein EYG95_07015, partial [Campylobacterales bacterium]|nr:hypothetical protein [Campylobacterales bacterium]